MKVAVVMLGALLVAFLFGGPALAQVPDEKELRESLGTFSRLSENPVLGVADGKGNYYDPARAVLTDASGKVRAYRVTIDRSTRKVVTFVPGPGPAVLSGIAGPKDRWEILVADDGALMQKRGGDLKQFRIVVAMDKKKIQVLNGRGGFFTVDAPPGEVLVELVKGTGVLHRAAPDVTAQLAQDYARQLGGDKSADLPPERVDVMRAVVNRYGVAVPGGGGKAKGLHDGGGGGADSTALFKARGNVFDRAVRFDAAALDAYLGDQLQHREKYACVNAAGVVRYWQLGLIRRDTDAAKAKDIDSYRAVLLPESVDGDWRKKVSRLTADDDLVFGQLKADGDLPVDVEVSLRQKAGGDPLIRVTVTKGEREDVFHCVVSPTKQRDGLVEAPPKGVDAPKHAEGPPPKGKEVVKGKETPPPSPVAQFWQDAKRKVPERFVNLLQSRCLPCHSKEGKSGMVAGVSVKDGKLHFDGKEIVTREQRLSLEGALDRMEFHVNLKDGATDQQPMPPRGPGGPTPVEREAMLDLIITWKEQVVSQLLSESIPKKK